MYKETTHRLRIAVLAGGESAERDVSLASGRAVAAALSAANHRIEHVDPAISDLAHLAWHDFDVCLIALHGGSGEDGRVQGLLESFGVCYTGSGPAVSRLAMSKSAAKERFAEAGVPTPDFVVFDERASDAPDVAQPGHRRGKALQPNKSYGAALPQPPPQNLCLAELRFPLVVKPDQQGSSIGVGFAGNEAELLARLNEARQFDSRVLLERWIDGREFTVALLGRQPLPLIEIVTPRGLFDYEAKYESALTEYRFEHGLSGAVAERLTGTAVAAAEALETTGLVRVDLMLDRACRPWVLEVNTVPGLTDHSLAPKAAAQAGLSMTDLCQWMIDDALVAEAPLRASGGEPSGGWPSQAVPSLAASLDGLVVRGTPRRAVPTDDQRPSSDSPLLGRVEYKR